MRDNLVNLTIIANALEQALLPRQYGIAARSVRHAIREIERLRAQVDGRRDGAEPQVIERAISQHENAA